MASIISKDGGRKRKCITIAHAITMFINILFLILYYLSAASITLIFENRRDPHTSEPQIATHLTHPPPIES